MTTPNTTDIREAAERASKTIATVERNLERWRSWYPNEESEVYVPRADLLALIVLSKAHLAEHPSDDNEPISYAWAKTLPGATDQGGGVSFECIEDIELWINEGETDVVLHRCGGEIELKNRTRDQVRQLLAGLGVEK